MQVTTELPQGSNESAEAVGHMLLKRDCQGTLGDSSLMLTKKLDTVTLEQLSLN